MDCIQEGSWFLSKKLCSLRISTVIPKVFSYRHGILESKLLSSLSLPPTGNLDLYDSNPAVKGGLRALHSCVVLTAVIWSKILQRTN